MHADSAACLLPVPQECSNSTRCFRGFAKLNTAEIRSTQIDGVIRSFRRMCTATRNVCTAETQLLHRNYLLRSTTYTVRTHLDNLRAPSALHARLWLCFEGPRLLCGNSNMLERLSVRQLAITVHHQGAAMPRQLGY